MHATGSLLLVKGPTSTFSDPPQVCELDGAHTSMMQQCDATWKPSESPRAVLSRQSTTAALPSCRASSSTRSRRSVHARRLASLAPSDRSLALSSLTDRDSDATALLSLRKAPPRISVGDLIRASAPVLGVTEQLAFLRCASARNTAECPPGALRSSADAAPSTSPPFSRTFIRPTIATLSKR